ncbi:MAG: response regulator [Chitinispirillaceae bacterium]|nr:response regulator [Chitinispirillaceae bacterium]
MKSILIVDDDRDLREVMKTVLAKQYSVQEAGSAKEAWATLTKFSPDLVLLDVMMESLSAGFTLAREIRNEEKYRNVKILMITNIDREKNIDFKSEAGDTTWLPVDDYIVKPVDPQDLFAKVQKLLS